MQLVNGQATIAYTVRVKNNGPNQAHDVQLVEETVNRVFYLDAMRQVIDVYNMGWHNYLTQREDDEKRRKRERQNAENKAKVLTDQANKMRAKATKARVTRARVAKPRATRPPTVPDQPILRPGMSNLLRT